MSMYHWGPLEIPILRAGCFLVQKRYNYQRIHLSNPPLQENGASLTHPQQIVFSEKRAEWKAINEWRSTHKICAVFWSSYNCINMSLLAFSYYNLGGGGEGQNLWTCLQNVSTLPSSMHSIKCNRTFSILTPSTPLLQATINESSLI